MKEEYGGCRGFERNRKPYSPPLTRVQATSLEAYAHPWGRDSTGTEVGPGETPSRGGPSPCPTPMNQPKRKSKEVGGHPQLVSNPGVVLPVWERSWGDAYLTCPTWKNIWEKNQSENEWPKGVKVFNGQMFLEEKLCIPLCFQNHVVQETHESLGHVGHERVWNYMILRYVWANEKMAQQFLRNCSKSCGV